MDITVKQSLKEFIRPLSDLEYNQLESNILQDGCREPLTLWKNDGQNILLDGHNRYKICSKHDVKFTTLFVDSVTVGKEELSLDSTERAQMWVAQNQNGRRNLDASDRAVLATKLLPVFAEEAHRAGKEKAAKAGEKGGRPSSLESTSSKPLPQNYGKGSQIEQKKEDNRHEREAAAQAAELVGASATYVAEVAKAAGYDNKNHTFKKPEVFAKIGSGAGQTKIPDIIRERKRKEIVKNLESVSAIKAKEIAGKYDVFVIDPPWPMEKIERDDRPRQANFDYPTMSIEEIGEDVSAALKKHTDTDAHVFLWTTQKFLPDTFDLLKFWNLKYVCVFVWHKPGGFQPIGLPQYNAEFVVYARKGTPKFIDTKKFNTCFEAPRGKHSEKPEEFYEIIRRVTAGRRLDMYNRRIINGFDGWGKETVAKG